SQGSLLLGAPPEMLKSRRLAPRDAQALRPAERDAYFRSCLGGEPFWVVGIARKTGPQAEWRRTGKARRRANGLQGVPRLSAALAGGARRAQLALGRGALLRGAPERGAGRPGALGLPLACWGRRPHFRCRALFLQRPHYPSPIQARVGPAPRLHA